MLRCNEDLDAYELNSPTINSVGRRRSRPDGISGMVGRD
jgi:hypothetical protein